MSELAEIVRETVAGQRDRVRGPRRPGPAQLPRRLRQARARVSGPATRVGRAPRRGRARGRVPRGRADARRPRGRPLRPALAPALAARGRRARPRPALAGRVIFRPTAIDGVLLVDLEPREDERGSFARALGTGGARRRGPRRRARAGQRRLQRARRHAPRPALPARAARGREARPLHARGDLRRRRRPARRTRRPTGAGSRSSSTSATARALYVPAGCAHGYQTLVDATETLYLHSAPYAPDAEGGVRWDDPALGIDWPAAEPRIVSEKDRSWPDLGGPA